jgi:hypothetical protein
MMCDTRRDCTNGYGFNSTNYPYPLDALSTCDNSSWLYSRKNCWHAQRVISVCFEFICEASFTPVTSRSFQADSEIFARALGRLAIAANELARPCAFIVGAVRSTALAMASHSAGDIAPAAAFTLLFY